MGYSSHSSETRGNSGLVTVLTVLLVLSILAIVGSVVVGGMFWKRSQAEQMLAMEMAARARDEAMHARKVAEMNAQEAAKAAETMKKRAVVSSSTDETKAAEDRKLRNLDVWISNDGKLTIDGESLESTKLEEWLRDTTRSEILKIVIRADETCLLTSAADAINACKNAGVDWSLEIEHAIN